MPLSTLALAASALAAPAPPTSVPAPAQRAWTLLVYGAADNDADGPILEFLDRVRAAIDDDPGIELVLFVDRSAGHSSDRASLGADFTGARVYRLRRDTAERLDGGDELRGLGEDEDVEVDSADPDLLARFVAYGKKTFPAKRTGLLIYGHSDGRAMCPDEDSKHEMGISAVTQEVDASLSVDFVGLELCNMGGIEAAYQWRPGNGAFSTEVLVAIPNAGPPLDWHRAFERIRSPGHASPAPEPHLDPAAMSAADFGKLLIEEGARGRREAARERPERVRHEAAGCYDLRAAEAAKKALDAFAVALATTSGKQALEAVRGTDPEPRTMAYSGDLGYAPYFDLYDFCARAAASEELSADARALARKAAEAVDALVIASFGMDAYTGFVPGRHGIFFTFPDGDGKPGGSPGGQPTPWARHGWYSPLPAKSQGGPSQAWSFLADGAVAGNRTVENWFELLDSWYDPDPDGNGGVNGYRW